MRLATTIGEMYQYASAPAEAVTFYRDTGFKYLDYSFCPAYKDGSAFMLDDERFWQQEVDDAAQAAADLGMEFVQAHAPCYNPLATDCDHERCMRAMLRSIEACGRLHIPVTVVHTSFGRQHRYPVDQHDYWEYNRKFLQPMLQTAEKHGVFICIENSGARDTQGCYTWQTPEDMLNFLDYMQHPLLACCWDTGHAVMDLKFDQYNDLCKLGKNLKAVHIHDNNINLDEHFPPFCGKLHLDRVVEALRDMEFAGAFTFEADGFMNHISGNGRLKQLPLEIRIDALKLLYKIGKFALTDYDIVVQ